MHHLAGLVQTLSFHTHTYTHIGKKMAARTLVRTTVAHMHHKCVLYSRTQKFGDLYKELISPFKWLQEGDDSHTLQIQLVKSRVKN